MQETKHSAERLLDIGRGVRLIEKRDSQTFGTDALLLAAFCRGIKGGRAAEFGCGSGAVSLLLAARGAFSQIAAVERDEALYDLACCNVRENGFSHTVTLLFADVRGLTPATAGGLFDAVFSNPPYFDPAAGRPSPNAARQTARHGTAGDINDFAAAAGRLLKKGGRFTVVWRPDRLPTLFTALRAAGLMPKRAAMAAAHPSAAPSIVLTEAVKDGGEGLMWLPTLYLATTAEQNAPPTDEARSVYESGVWPQEGRRHP